MGLNTLSQNDRLELAFFSRIYLVHWELSGKTLYISDRNYAYDTGSVRNYENYLFDLSGLPVDLMRIRANQNPKITLRFRNDRILTADTLIELNSTYRFCFSTIKIYELRLVAQDETFASDVKQLVYRGVCGQPHDITRGEFVIDCQSVMLAKRDRLPLQVVDSAVDANADPDDLGMIRNTVYGAVGHIPCRSVKAGARDSLTADITASATTITVSGDTKITFPSTGTIQINDEQITYTGFTSNQFTGCTRGANSTTAAAHERGASACQVLTEYVYEAAKHPMKAIDTVYVDGVRQTSGVTAYTGQAEDELTGYAGRAVVKFTVLPTIKKQVNLDVNDGITVSDNIAITVSGSNKEIYPDGESHSSSVTNATNIYDGAQDSHATLPSDGEWVQANFPSTSYGTIIKQYIYCVMDTTGDGVITSGWTPSSLPAGDKDTYRFQKTGGSWSDAFRVELDGAGNTQVHEIWKVVEYTSSSTKTGSASRSGAVTLTGNSSADTVIGQIITVDGEGYQDDGSGTYTGTPDALITRPDHVFKHILVALLGESAGDIGSSFATSGTLYGSTYKLAFILHEVSRQADALLQALAFQCRSKFLEWQGAFELTYMGSAPAVSRTFTDDDCLEEPRFGFTAEIDIRNRIYAHYKRDYRKAGGPEACDGVESDSDATSITNNGERVETVELSACRTQAMAANWVAWYLTQRKEEWRTLALAVPWIGKALDAGDSFSLTWDFWSGVVWDLVNVEVDHMRERIRLTGQEWPS